MDIVIKKMVCKHQKQLLVVRKIDNTFHLFRLWYYRDELKREVDYGVFKQEQKAINYAKGYTPYSTESINKKEWELVF